MSLSTASDVALSHGPDDIFWGAALSIPRGARIAILGSNGVGRTSLLRMHVGLEEPTFVKHAGRWTTTTLFFF